MVRAPSGLDMDHLRLETQKIAPLDLTACHPEIGPTVGGPLGRNTVGYL